jgi:hypothetical protein
MINAVVFQRRIGALGLICSMATATHVVQQRAAARDPHHGAYASADPTPDEVMERAVQAAGGRQALDRIKTLQMIMAVNMPGLEMQLETCWSRDGGRLYRATLPMGETRMVSDGKLAWMNNPTGGYLLLSDEQARSLDQQASMFMHMLDPKAQTGASMKSIGNAGKQTFANKECWRLHYVLSDGREGDVFFDVASGLPVGFERIETQHSKPARARCTFGEWKPEGEVQFYRQFRMETSLEGAVPMDMAVTKVAVNTIDKTVFAAPQEVVALAAKSPRAAATAPSAATAPKKEISPNDLTPEQLAKAIQVLEGFKGTGDVNAMKQMLQRVEPILGKVPENERLAVEYALQELKKEIARLGG